MIFDLVDAIKNADIYTLIAIVLTSAVLLLLCLPSHEFAHAYTAYKLGDYTAKYQGRLSLNPFKHLDILGSIMILSIGVGYAKPVPVNMLNFKNKKRDMALVALAGPLMNLLFGVVFAFLSVAFGFIIFSVPQLLYTNNEFLIFTVNCIGFVLDTVAQISISLAIFNLIPIPPFDGSRILGYFLPDRIYYKLMQYEQIIFIFVMAALWLGFLSGPLSVVTQTVTNGIYWLVSLPFGGF